MYKKTETQSFAPWGLLFSNWYDKNALYQLQPLFCVKDLCVKNTQGLVN
jgi:hypothetical protein